VVDGFDTIIVQPEEVIIERFLHHKQQFLACGEAQSHVWLAFHNALFRTKEYESVPWPKLPPYAPPSLNLQLLNAGCYIGYAKIVSEVFSDIPTSPNSNDQKFLTSQYLDGKVAVDSGCTLFHLWRNTHGCQFVSAEEARKCAPYRKPYYRNEDMNNDSIFENSRRQGGSKDSIRQEGEFVETPGMGGGVVVDREAATTPCVLHIHCLRNADDLMRKLNLPLMEGANLWRSTTYYFYSLKGHTEAHITASILLLCGLAMFAAMGVCGISFLLLIFSLVMPSVISPDDMLPFALVFLSITLILMFIVVSIVKYNNRPRNGTKRYVDSSL